MYSIKIENKHMLKIQNHLKIAIVTPSYQRDHFLLQTLSYVEQQQHQATEIRWFILDDFPNISAHKALFQTKNYVEYHWRSEKQALGLKRNRLNNMALHWGADIICSMDDDDWYGPTYVQEMSDLLWEDEANEFVGSGEDYYYEVKKNRVLKILAVREFSSCNGVLCYKTRVLKDRQYDDSANFAEEQHFLNHAKIIQHPNIQRLHLALAHQSNTVTKKNYCYGDSHLVDLSLDDFPMTEKDKLFYLSLHQRSTNIQKG